MPKIIEGTFTNPTGNFAIVATRWNEFIVAKLVEGALDALKRHGVQDKNITVVYCPGSFELPLVCSKLAQSKKYAAVIALGAVIRGATAHFEYVSSEATKGIAQVMMQTGVPCVFGVLTTDTIEQAIERAGTKAGNKGYEAGTTALEMASLVKQL